MKSLEHPPAGELRSWQRQCALPLMARVSERLADMLIAGCELQADLAGADAGALRSIAPEVDDVVARIDALLKLCAE